MIGAMMRSSLSPYLSSLSPSLSCLSLTFPIPLFLPLPLPPHVIPPSFLSDPVSVPADLSGFYSEALMNVATVFSASTHAINHPDVPYLAPVSRKVYPRTHTHTHALSLSPPPFPRLLA